MTFVARYSTAGNTFPFGAQSVDVPAPMPDTVPMPPTPHPQPPGPEPVPPEIDEPPGSPGTGEPVEEPNPPSSPIGASQHRAAQSRLARGTEADSRVRGEPAPLPARQRCVEMVWNQAGYLLALLAADGTIRLANPAWRGILGHDPAMLVGRRLHQFAHPDDVAVVLAGLQCPRTSPAGEIRSRWSLADGSGFRTVSWIRCAEGEEMAFCGRFEGAQPSADESSLAQAQRLRAVGRACSGISQEFNNLLQSLRHSLELIRRDPDDSELVRQHAEHALTVAATGSRMTGQLLEFIGLQRTTLRPVHLAGLLAIRGELEQLLGPQVELQLTGFQDAGWVLAVPERLRAALFNLAINGAEAMPRGGRLTLRCERLNLERDQELPTGAYVQISVVDQGIGIAESIRGHVIEPFFTTKPVGDGPGLGLSQVHGLARLCGGVLRIGEGSDGRGTHVKLLLPAAPGGSDCARHETSRTHSMA